MSALKAQGLDAFWEVVERFRQVQTASGRLAARRHEQDQDWMWALIDAGLKQRFRAHAAVNEALPALSQEVTAGRVLPSVAARRLLDLFD